MGIFSSKEEIEVHTSIVRVIEDSRVPDARITSLVYGIMSGVGIADSLIDTAVNGNFRNFERMYRWAKAGNYFYGLPNARVMSNNDGYDRVQAILDTLAGTPVTIEYLHFRPPNNVHIGWQEVTEEYGYVASTNELTVLSALKGHTVYLDRLEAIHHIEVAEIPDRGTLGSFQGSSQAGYAPDREATDLSGLVDDQSWQQGSALEEGVNIHYLWRDETGTLIQEAINKPLSAYSMDEEYYQVKYSYTQGGEDVVAYWTYSPKQALHPNLDDVYKLNFTTSGTYFPFVIFRRQGENRSTFFTRTSEEYTSTKKLLDILGLDYREMSDSIHENPDIDNIEQAAMIMAVPINSENEVEIEYLFRFFDGLHEQTPVPPADSVESASSLSSTTSNGYAVQIADADFRITMSYSRIRKRIRAGVIGGIGTYANDMIATDEDGVRMPASTSQTRYFRHQITASAYEEIAVVDPQLRYDIYEGEGTIGKGKDGKLLIPLDYGITSDMSLLSREELYYRSLHLVFNSLFITETSWLDSGFFKIFIAVVVVIITILSGGAPVGAFIAALQAGASVAAMAVLSLLVKTLVTQFVLKVTAKALGPDLAFMLAVVAAVAGGVKALKSGGFGQDVWAQNLMKAATGLSSAAQKNLQGLGVAIQGEAESFGLMTEERYAEIEEVNNLLEPGLLDPFIFIGQEPTTIFGEAPQDYFTRSVHIGNIGTLGFDIVENFVAGSLKLPSIDTTVGDTFYV